MGIFARFKAPSFTAVRCFVGPDDLGGEEVKATFGTFGDALIFAKATCKRYGGKPVIVHVDIYCNKSGNRVYNMYA